MGFGILSGGPIAVGDLDGTLPTSATYSKCGSGPGGTNYSVNYELGRVKNTPNSSFTILANSSTSMKPAPYSLATAKTTPGPLGVNGFYMSYWYDKRGVSQGFNFSVGFTGTSYGKYGNDLCTGTATASVTRNPYRITVPSNFIINLAGTVGTGTNSASVSITGRCAGASTNWQVTDTATDCTYDGTTAATWTYDNTSYWPI